MNNIPRESLELVGPLLVTALDGEGEPVSLASLEVSITTTTDRPETWESPVTVGGSRYVLVGPPDRELTVREWKVWGRLTDSPEVPVFEIGKFRIL